MACTMYQHNELESVWVAPLCFLYSMSCSVEGSSSTRYLIHSNFDPTTLRLNTNHCTTSFKSGWYKSIHSHKPLSRIQTYSLPIWRRQYQWIYSTPSPTERGSCIWIDSWLAALKKDSKMSLSLDLRPEIAGMYKVYRSLLKKFCTCQSGKKAYIHRSSYHSTQTYNRVWDSKSRPLIVIAFWVLNVLLTSGGTPT